MHAHAASSYPPVSVCVCGPDPAPPFQLTGSVKGKARTVLNEALARGDIGVAVGTHALISDSTQFARLGLAVVDEQHK